MRLQMLAILVAGLASLPVQAAAPPRYDPPAETATLAPGDHVDQVTATCSICHSVDYITTQPSGLPDPKAFWTAEVAKMRTAYGAPISAEDAQVAVDYLSQHYR